ncbi:MAG: alpha/beta hydrolase [Burkholderiales bacterium]
MATRVPSVVMLHASASSSRQWQPLAAAIGQRLRVHAIDLHGHGERSPWPGARPLALMDEAALAAPLVLRAGGAHLVGHSYGAAVALKLAAMLPRHVKSVTVYEPVMFRWLVEANADEAADVLAVVNEIERHLGFGSMHDAARAFVDFWSGEGAFDAAGTSRRDAIASRMRTVAAHFHALLLEPLEMKHVARLCIPMMVMTGGRTVRAMRRLEQMTLQAWPHARHRVIGAAGHMGPITHADEVNREVLGFLEREARMAA